MVLERQSNESIPIYFQISPTKGGGGWGACACHIEISLLKYCKSVLRRETYFSLFY